MKVISSSFLLVDCWSLWWELQLETLRTARRAQSTVVVKCWGPWGCCKHDSDSLWSWACLGLLSELEKLLSHQQTVWWGEWREEVEEEREKEQCLQSKSRIDGLGYFPNSHTSVLRAGCLAIAVSATLETALPTPPLFTWDAVGVEVLDIVIWLPIEVTPSWTWLEMGDSVCMPPLLWPSGSMSLLLVWIWFSVLRCSRAAAPSPLLPVIGVMFN